MTRRAVAGAATLATAFGLLFAAPPPQAVAGGCGENSGPLCRKNESCLWILFFKQCTEKYDYYPG